MYGKSISPYETDERGKAMNMVIKLWEEHVWCVYGDRLPFVEEAGRFLSLYRGQFEGGREGLKGEIIEIVHCSSVGDIDWEQWITLFPQDRRRNIE